jgi:Rps23 Pro-64 3,4-dihydroxylase Tpa1-like proline 4-hydroxylase
MINPDADFAPYRAALAARGRVQIPGFLVEEAAQRLHACLAHEVPWSLAERGTGPERTVAPDELARWGADGYARRIAELAVEAKDSFAFAYDSYMMIKNYVDAPPTQLPLLRFVVELLNSPDFIAFAQELCGHRGLRRVNAQATRYRPGHFLKRHSDAHSGEGREFAYVLNLTSRWEADWGGQLQFVDEAGGVIESFLPRFNTLSLFRVPADHVVTLVAPWAREDRLAITGWFLT